MSIRAEVTEKLRELRDGLKKLPELSTLIEDIYDIFDIHSEWLGSLQKDIEMLKEEIKTLKGEKK